MLYSIGAVAKKTGISSYTLRYYDKAGLTPFVKRDDRGQRVFDDDGLESLGLIRCLKQTGMPLEDIRQFVHWCDGGDETLPERLTMFEKQREAVLDQVHQSLLNLRKVNHKIDSYRRACELGSEAQVDCDYIPKRTASDLLRQVREYEETQQL
ncbi:MerR family transcriptional regulator [Lactiplantibacillus mudanjiangensis]|uniref:Transcription regulator [Lactobacillus plantarum JDM1] n=1 Tax=Lactiplantibacillus mudanjiangensis TaxID=1296538 RepID=A0A660E2M7_9LACO|nr:MerR family transcriptional regulator [Lactiplantibacillus mudanjiangensis]VDG19236.1 transcription regulator [Lactobacillus plantarum JDM1] [Lactiplantibacillus mudanjiangensis]VDG25603.1 transcription regulator [Lactobacillus plantarum JDM1] [Lactiplantibacillus mudanjiangensis]VDG29999.1 transcription regulator [Lactobacillus plantarum JDM1] [Lactiplantibacillus mudanjiangensis]VDG33308.1 transcription regulator [Lactobacillus plantarum JDM1] [Lactiplantibacillus mudanjiangensis]